MSRSAAKLIGQFYSPEQVGNTLVNWLQLGNRESLLDPSCGDGRFICHHGNSVGVDSCAASCQKARIRAPRATIHQAEFFQWSAHNSQRFDCVAGNPPFIRYHNFNGDVRRRALDLSALHGAKFSALTSSWAPFLVVASGLLKPGGMMAFVVPAKIEHSNYSATLLEYLVTHFDRLLIVAIKEKIFADLSEDVWLLYASGKGGKCKFVELVTWERFQTASFPLQNTKRISIASLRNQRMRLRRFLLPDAVLDYYSSLPKAGGVASFGSIAQIGIGYVTGANNFFHLRPSDAERLRIPAPLLRVSVRKGDQLSSNHIDKRVVRSWIDGDRPVLLLNLSKTQTPPAAVRRYLESEAALEARKSYKCRNREPWYVVPDVTAPDAFLNYISGNSPNLFGKLAGCVCTNSVHAVRLKHRISLDRLVKAWRHPVCGLSIELEGHPLGGGLLKNEPGEATKIPLAFGENRKWRC